MDVTQNPPQWAKQSLYAKEKGSSRSYGKSLRIRQHVLTHHAANLFTTKEIVRELAEQQIAVPDVRVVLFRMEREGLLVRLFPGAYVTHDFYQAQESAHA